MTTTASELLAFQALTGVLVISADSVERVNVQIYAAGVQGRDALAAILGEALDAQVDQAGRSLFVESGVVLVEVLSEEE